MKNRVVCQATRPKIGNPSVSIVVGSRWSPLQSLEIADKIRPQADHFREGIEAVAEGAILK